MFRETASFKRNLLHKFVSVRGLHLKIRNGPGLVQAVLYHPSHELIRCHTNGSTQTGPNPNLIESLVYLHLKVLAQHNGGRN